MKPEQPSTIVDKAAWDDLQRLDEHGEGLSEWEINFVESLTKQLRAGRWLSPAQSEKLHDIMAKRLE